MSKPQKVAAPAKEKETTPAVEDKPTKTRNGKTKKDFDTIDKYYDYRAAEADKKAAEFQQARDRYREKAENARNFTPDQQKDAKRLAKLQTELTELQKTVPDELQ